VKLYNEKSSIVYFGQIDNPYDKFLSQKYILTFLKNKTGRVLDLGCGAGRNSVALAKMGFDIVSVDNLSKPLEIANMYAKKSNVLNKIKFIQKDITNLKNEELGKFDYCILQEVIEHIVDYQKAVDFAYSSLKKGGTLLLSTQYNPKLWNTTDDYAQHIRRFTKYEIIETVKKFSSRQIIISGFPILWLVHITYSLGLTIFHKAHDTPKFMKHSYLLYLYTSIFPHLLNIDSMFNFTELGREIVVYAVK
jgi:ubiquinone biosynthesis O-methyltransferase